MQLTTSNFAVLNLSTNVVDGGYALGEYASFKDDGVEYTVTLLKGGEVGTYKVDLRKS